MQTDCCKRTQIGKPLSPRLLVMMVHHFHHPPESLGLNGAVASRTFHAQLHHPCVVTDCNRRALKKECLSAALLHCVAGPLPKASLPCAGSSASASHSNLIATALSCSMVVAVCQLNLQEQQRWCSVQTSDWHAAHAICPRRDAASNNLRYSAAGGTQSSWTSEAPVP